MTLNTWDLVCRQDTHHCGVGGGRPISCQSFAFSTFPDFILEYTIEFYTLTGTGEVYVSGDRVSNQQPHLHYHIKGCCDIWRQHPYLLHSSPTVRVGTIYRQYYWEQYIGPLLAKIPMILLLLAFVLIHNFKFQIFVIVLLLLVFKIRNIGLFLVCIWYCVGIVHLQALITKVKIIS